MLKVDVTVETLDSGGGRPEVECCRMDTPRAQNSRAGRSRADSRNVRMAWVGGRRPEAECCRRGRPRIRGLALPPGTRRGLAGRSGRVASGRDLGSDPRTRNNFPPTILVSTPSLTDSVPSCSAADVEVLSCVCAGDIVLKDFNDVGFQGY